MGNKAPAGQNEPMAGFRVKEIRKLSPAAKCGLLLSADYILSANGKSLKTMDPSSIAELIKVRSQTLRPCFSFRVPCANSTMWVWGEQSNENREVHLKVFNENTCKVRDVTIVPSKDWPGEGLLGVVLRLETYDPYMRTSTGVRSRPLHSAHAIFGASLFSLALSRHWVYFLLMVAVGGCGHQDFNITLEDVYAKDNPIARRSAARQPAASKQAAGGAAAGEQIVNGVNAYSQHSSPDKRAQASAKKRATLGAL